jgi:Bacterial regulatory proteins, tetR family
VRQTRDRECDPGVTPASRAPNQLLRSPLPSALQKETRPYEVFEKDSLRCQLTLRYVPLKLESMKKEVLPAVRKGRPPSEMAASHAVIMDAVYALLEEKSVRDLTIEAVAKRAGVGKPTLYKWWPTKATLVLAMLCERMAPKLEKPTVLTAEQSLRFRVRSLIDAFNGPFGKIVAGLIAEGQSEPGRSSGIL